ncbi:MAG TPA: hypothetical protein VGL86_30915 [Polyangia bacterium]
MSFQPDPSTRRTQLGVSGSLGSAPAKPWKRVESNASDDGACHA